MKFEGTVDIKAPRDRVWAFVSDPAQVAACGPGVESVDMVDETHYKTIAKIGVGFISARFNGDIEIVDTKIDGPLEAGTISGTVAVEVHTAAPRHAARLRFSDGAIWALLAA